MRPRLFSKRRRSPDPNRPHAPARRCGPSERRTHPLARIPRFALGIAGAVVLALSLALTLHAAIAAYAAPGQTIDRALGCTRTIRSVLEGHLCDGYYLGTPYGNTAPGVYGDTSAGGMAQWDCWHPNGAPKPGVSGYMNCAGFVAAVIREAGGDTAPVAAHVASSGYNKGNEANASKWKWFALDSGFLAGQYDTKEQMLSAGILEKGDIIYIQPVNFNGQNDCHIMFFWGDSPDEDLAWHSAIHGDGVVAGSPDHGNMISKITPKGSAAYYQVYKVQHTVDVTLQKVSSRPEINTGLDAYRLAGATYEIRRAADDVLVTTVTTDDAGRATVALEPDCAYYAQETVAPQGYALNPERIAFDTGQVTEVEVPDAPGTLTFRIEKADAATGGAAQAGATLEGAEYRLVDAGGTAHVTTTDSQGRAAFTDIPLGEVSVTETRAPEGYRPDPTVRTYTADPSQMNDAGVVEIAPERDFIEMPIAFDLSITKYRDTGSEESGIQTPASGVRFDIISNSTGETIGSIVTDGDGRATSAGSWFGAGERTPGISGAIPYDAGGYTVREALETVPEGHRPAPDWQVSPKQMADGATLSYIIDNERVTSRLQIVKTDAESGLVVPLAGMSFQVLDADRNPVSQEVTYPSPSHIDTFTTDESGCVTLPAPLEPGTYLLREIAAVRPYVVNGEELSFEISSAPDAEPLTVVKFADEQARGRATIKKFCAGAVDGTCEETLEGAEFDVVAQEDIVSPDGTVRALGGETVDHVETDEHGIAVTDLLYLGSGTARYAFVETEPPAGHVLDDTPHEFTLAYANGETPVVETAVEVSNEPTEVTVNKTVLGRGDALPGAVFELWRSEDDERADDGAGGAVIGPQEGTATRVETDEDGRIVLRHLTAGNYRLREASAPAGYLADTAVRFFTVDGSGLVEGLSSLTFDIADDYTKIDISKRNISDEREIPGAHLAVRDEGGEVVAEWTSTEAEHRIEALPPGSYTLTEELTPHSYDQATAVPFTVEATGEVQRVVMRDEPIEVTAEVDKRQQIADPVSAGTEADRTVDAGGSNHAAVTPSDTGTYAYTIDFRSAASTWVDEFTVTDLVDAAENGLAEVRSITTPVTQGDYDGKLNVWYRTNRTPEDFEDDTGANATLSDGHGNPWLSDETTSEALGGDGRAVSYTGWRLWAQDLPTDEPTEVAVADLGLEQGERVVAIRLEYGRVEKGFSSRSDGWDRDLIKDEHDDISEVPAGEGEGPLVVSLSVTDTYREGTVLENAAEVDAYRNGGNTNDGERLEGHDGDRVLQQPRAVPSPLGILPQTGAVSPIPALLMTAAAAWTVSLLFGRRGRRGLPMNLKTMRPRTQGAC